MRCALVLVCMTAACGVDLDVPPNTRVACSRDADCTDGQVCAPLIGRCVDTIDVAPPSLINAEASATDRVRVIYSEPVLCATVGDAAGYAITPALDVVLAVGVGCDGPDTLTTETLLFTVQQVAGEPYMLVVAGVRDEGGNALADDGSAIAFTGFGQRPDATPPGTLTPADHARVLGANQGLAWTFRPGATSYVVEVATDAEFMTHVPGSPFVVAAPATTLELRGLDDVTYFWRIRSDLTAPTEVLPVHDFDVLVDTVYVACDGPGPCSDDGVHNGSRTRPYTSIPRALAAAAELSTSLDVPNVAVKIAARGPAASYAGPVLVQWQSVTMTGGWDSTFTTRDMDPGVTLLENSGAVLAIANVPQPIAVVIEGLTLRTTGTAPRSPALRVTSASNALTIRNVVVRGAATPSSALAAITGGPADGPLVTGCRFIADVVPGDRGTVLQIANAAPRITSTEVGFDVTTGANTAVAVDVFGPLPGDAIIESSTLAAASATAASNALSVTILAESAGGLVLRDVLATSGAAESSEVLEIGLAPRILIERSVLSAGPASVRGHVIGEDFAGQLAIRNSVLQAASGPNPDGETLQIQESMAVELTNSVVIGPLGGAPPLRVVSGHPIVTNTIIIPRSGTTCVDQAWDLVSNRPTWGTPTAFQNNALVACAQAYVIANSDDGSPPPTVATTATDVDSLSGLPLRASDCNDATCPQARFVANVVLPGASLGDVLVDADGPITTCRRSRTTTTICARPPTYSYAKADWGRVSRAARRSANSRAAMCRRRTSTARRGRRPTPSAPTRSLEGRGIRGA